MKEKPDKPKKMGRPPKAKGERLSTQLNVRVSEDVRQGLDAYLAKHRHEYGWQELADAVRFIIARALRDDGTM